MTRERHPENADPHQATPAFNRAVLRWKNAHITASVARHRADDARAEVKTSIATSGVDHVVTLYGTIALRTKKYVDWEALARSALAPHIVEAMVAVHTKESAPFIQAPDGWSAEAHEPTRKSIKLGRAARAAKRARR